VMGSTGMAPHGNKGHALRFKNEAGPGRLIAEHGNVNLLPPDRKPHDATRPTLLVKAKCFVDGDREVPCLNPRGLAEHVSTWRLLWRRRDLMWQEFYPSEDESWARLRCAQGAPRGV